MKKVKLFIITGMSGAGKSQTLKCFEDLGYYCVDNLPRDLLRDFSKLIRGKKYLSKVALGIDTRECRFFKGFADAIDNLKKTGIDLKIIFLDASDQVILQRFSETRHKHPLGKNLSCAIKRERKVLSALKSKADKVIDTSKLTLGELKESVSSNLELKKSKEMNLSVVSFGYKYGLPLDADIVMDVRFIVNPNYIPKLKNKTGLDASVIKYLEEKTVIKKFISKYISQIKELLPLYIKEGKSYLTIAVGCTGGKHRSVYTASAIAKSLLKMGFSVSEYHRDIRKNR